MADFQDRTIYNKPAGNFLSITPILVFIIIYVVVSIIIGDFYKIPLSVALLASSLYAIFICRGKRLNERIEAFAKEAGNTNVMYMIWIFILAGTFASLAEKTGGVEATVAMTINQLPPSLVVPGLFAAACFISMAIGTSVGTVVALTPLAVNFAQNAGANIPFFIAVILGGAFFGDNLSFISDTTIAATRTQGCKMSEKFKANFLLVLPAALLTLIIYFITDTRDYQPIAETEVNLWLVVPYISVIALAIAGINVTMTLLAGIFLSFIIGLFSGTDIFILLGFMGDGIDGMGNLIIVTILAAGMLGLIKEAGGVDYLLKALSKGMKGRRGAKASIAFLVSIVNFCTANNTVAILTVGSISEKIAKNYKIAPRNSASLLDTASCIVQCLIPYGAQTLLATSLAGISAVAPWKYLVYPWVLLVIVIISILIDKDYFFSRRNNAAALSDRN